MPLEKYLDRHPRGAECEVLVPWSRDQPGVEARAAALGVAEVIAKQERTALRLAAAIDRV